MKKNTFLLAMLLMAFVATNNVFAQASIIGKWKFNKLELKPAAGKKFTSEQAKGIEAYKKAMLPRFTGAVWAFEETTYAITETSKQEPVETGNYTFVEEKNQLVMTRSGSNTSQKQPERGR